jgi:hypothetical protein
MDEDSLYYALPTPREVRTRGMPEDLRRFYRSHEGIGLETPPDRAVRLARLDEVRPVGWRDLHIVGDDEPPHQGWESFAGWRIGYSDMLDEIVYIVHAPGVPPGAVLAMGTGMTMGPGGNDANGPGSAIVVAASFDDWIRRLEQHGPLAHGLFVDDELPDEVAAKLHAELARLNPRSDYAK